MSRDIKEAKKFGIILSIILIVIGVVIPVFKDHSIHLWIVYLAGIIFLFSLFFTHIFIHFYRLWLKITRIIGKIVSSVILSIIFYLVVTPVGLIIRFLRKDPLDRKWDKQTDTYWLKRDINLNSPERLKRQF
jgi:hypothetical protein